MNRNVIIHNSINFIGFLLGKTTSCKSSHLSSSSCNRKTSALGQAIPQTRSKIDRVALAVLSECADPGIGGNCGILQHSVLCKAVSVFQLEQ